MPYASHPLNFASIATLFSGFSLFHIQMKQHLVQNQYLLQKKIHNLDFFFQLFSVDINKTILTSAVGIWLISLCEEEFPFLST